MKQFSGKDGQVDSARISNGDVRRRGKLSRAVAEALESRRLLTVSVSVSDSLVDTHESADTSSLFRQSETSNIVYTPVGYTAPIVVVSYTDSTATSYNSAYDDFYGNTSYSNNGGSTFNTPADHLPSPATNDYSTGTSDATRAHKGDAGNLDLAYDAATGYDYLVSLSDGSAAQQVIQLYDSTNNGGTFAYDGTVTPQPDNTAWSSTIKQFDRPWLAIDNYTLSTSAYRYVATYVEDNNIYVTRTTNPSSWPVPGSDGPVGTQLASSSGVDFANHAEVVIGHNTTSNTDYVYVVWAEMDFDSANHVGGEDLKFKMEWSSNYTTSSSPSWNGPYTLNSSTPDADRVHDLTLKNGPTRTSVSPSIASNPVNGDLYVAFLEGDAGDPTTSSPEAAPGMDIYLTGWAHGSTSAFTSPVLITTDTLGSGAAEDQWQPTMAVAPTGSVIFVGFYDRRQDSSNTNYQVYGAFATVSGGSIDTFDPTNNVQIDPITGTDEYSIPSGDDAYNNHTFMGDYDQASADYSYFYYTYMTTHYVTSGSYFDPEIHLARISIPYPTTAPVLPSSFTAAGGSSAAALAWTGSYSSTEYAEVDWSTGTSWQEYATTAANNHAMSFAPSGYSSSITYYFRIRVYENDNSSSSDYAYAQTHTDTPSLTTVGTYDVENDRVDVSWSGSYPSSAHMHVQFSVDTGSTWHDLSGNTTTADSAYGVAAGLLSYADPVDLTQVRLRIQVQYTDGYSNVSNVVGLGLPQILTVTDDGNGEYELTWASGVFTGDMYMQWKDPYGDDWLPEDMTCVTIAADGWGAICGLYAYEGYTFRIGNTMGTADLIWSSD